MRIIAILILLLIIPGALGLGISPAKVTLPYEGPYEFTFRPILSNGEDGIITIRAEGDLAAHITFDETAVRNGEVVKGTLTLPEVLAPGPHAQSIVLTLQSNEQATVAATAEVAALLVLNVPYPDEYLTADWSIDRDTGNGVALITVSLQNLGSRASTPDIQVTISDEQRSDVLPLASPTVAPGSFAKAESSYDPAARNMPPGVYQAQLQVSYNDQVITKTHEERFGLPLVELTSIQYEDEAGTIKPVDVTGRIAWNVPVNATVQILLDGNQVMEELFPIQGEFEHRIYLDTAATGVPQSEITIILTAEGISTSLTRDITLPQDTKSNLFPIIAWTLVLAAIIAAILWWRKRSPQEPPSS